MAAGADPTRLIVDFSDDVSAETLANNGFDRDPDQRLLGRRIACTASTSRPPTEAAAAQARAVPRSQRRERRLRSFASIPPGEDAIRSAPAPLDRRDGGRMRGRRPPDSALPRTTPASSTSGTCASWACPTPGSVGNGKGVVVAVIDTGVTKVARPGRDRSSSPGYNFVANNANAADDHGHGTHVAGTIAQSTNNKRRRRRRRLRRRHHAAQGAVSARGSGSVAGITQAIRWAADHGANVINMSLGGPTPMGSMAQRREVRARQGRRHRRGGRQRRARPGRLPGGLPGRGRGGGHAVRRDARPSIRTGARRSTSPRRAGTPASTRTATASPTASCNTPSSPATRRRPTTCGSWARRWRRRTRRASRR